MVPRDVRDLIRSRFSAYHGSEASADFPQYCRVDGYSGPDAVLGWRNAGPDRLFLETYLDEPVEAAVARVLQRPVDRSRIVEIGAHASNRCVATVRLWERAARELGDQHDVAVAVLTAPLRAMFARVGFAIHAIAPARAERLPGNGAGWGRYYQADPVVCAGEIAPARARLGIFSPAGREARR